MDDRDAVVPWPLMVKPRASIPTRAIRNPSREKVPRDPESP
jgi:hypothetical protein